MRGLQRSGTCRAIVDGCAGGIRQADGHLGWFRVQNGIPVGARQEARYLHGLSALRKILLPEVQLYRLPQNRVGYFILP